MATPQTLKSSKPTISTRLTPSGAYDGEAVAKGRGQNLKDVAIYGREGQTGARKQGEIAIHAIRGGEIVGDHTVMFIADGEMVEITHSP